jgi:hypothetical protein
MANNIVKFDEKGDGLARYTIYNYQRSTTGKTDYKVSTSQCQCCQMV